VSFTALVVHSGRSVEPFGDSAREMLFAGTTVGETVDAQLHKRGFSIVHVAAGAPWPALAGTVVVLSDVVYVSDKCLGDFVARAIGLLPQHPALRLALLQTAASDYLRPVSSIAVEPLDAAGPGARPVTKEGRERDASHRLAYDCFVVDGAWLQQQHGDMMAALRERATRLVIAKRELSVPMRMPVLAEKKSPHESAMPISSTVAAHVEHWTHVLWLNHMALGIRMLELARAHKLWAVGRALSVPFHGAPWHATSWLKAGVRIGKNVRIDRSAQVESSILGDNVVIGARATVHGSILGDGAVVEDHGHVVSSVLGPRATVTPRTIVIMSSIGHDAVVSNIKLQVSVLGRGASLSMWAGLLDAKLQGTVDVFVDGKKHDTERSYVGSCIGHRSHVGAKVLLLPGRALPNDTSVVMHPDDVIGHIPADLPPGVAYVRDRGTLVPLSSVVHRSRSGVLD
jgi:acetyltransferase-like isoleucine patch superfamily enzyme